MIRPLSRLLIMTAALTVLGSGIAIADVFEIGAAGELVSLNASSDVRSSGGGMLTHPELLVIAADAAGLSPDLVAAVAWCESRFRPRVISPAGAIGEMQLMPATAKALGVDAFDTLQNYAGGSRYLATLLGRYDNDVTLALAAYNAGPGAVDKYGGVPPYPETKAYVAAVLSRLASISSRNNSEAFSP